MLATDLNNTVAIVTGASKGIGKATAARLASRGASVAICSRNQDEIENTATEIEDEHDSPILGVACDVTKPDEVSAFIDEVTEEFGAIDVLVNNVGDSIDDGMVHEIDVDTWDRNLMLNLRGTFLCTREIIPMMVDNGGGSIVHVSAVNGMTGIGYSAYSTAKAGIVSFSRLIATQYGYHGVRSNVVSPGTIVTPSRQERRESVEDEARKQLLDQYPIGRFGTPDEVAAAISFLASEDASFITGATLPVDGGLTSGLDHTFEQEYYDIESEP